MIRRTLLLVVALLVAGAWFGSAAQADSYTPPANPPAPGPATQVAARGQDPTVVSASTQLPQTGSSSTETLLRVGIVLVAAGGVLVLTTRRRATVTS